jgi:hypothetical protein
LVADESTTNIILRLTFTEGEELVAQLGAIMLTPRSQITRVPDVPRTQLSIYADSVGAAGTSALPRLGRALFPFVHVLMRVTAVTWPQVLIALHLQEDMGFSRIQIGIAVGAGILVLVLFFGYLMWLNGQGPVLSRSEDRDPLSGTPNSISLNPLRDRSTERLAAKYLDAMRDGHCPEQLAAWEKDYRKKYAAFICASEAQHPLISWKVVDWEDNPPLRILHYRGKRLNAPGQSGTYKELFSVTLEDKGGEWVVTKYDAMY